MADLDKQKEIVSTFRTFAIFSLTILFSLIAYLFTSIHKLSNIQLLFLFGTILLSATIFVFFIYFLIKAINKLKDL